MTSIFIRYFEKTLLSAFLLLILFVLPLISQPIVTENPPPQFDSAAEAIQQTYQKYLDQGLSYFMDGNYSKAAELFREAIKIKPDDPTAHKALKSVEKKLSKETAVSTQAEDEKIKKAKQYYSAKQYFVTIITLKSILEKNPTSDKAKELIEKVQSDLEKFVQKEPSQSYEWLVNQGMLAYMQERYMDSLSYWQKAIEINSSNQVLSLAIDEAKARLTAEPVLKDESASPPVLKDESARATAPEVVSPPVSSKPTPLPGIPSKEMASVEVAKLPSVEPVIEEERKKQEELKRMEDERIRQEELKKVEEEEKKRAEEARMTETPSLPSVDVQLTEPSQNISIAPIPLAKIPLEIEQASSLLSKKEYDRAVKILQKFLDSHPEHPEAADLLKKVQLERKRNATKLYNEGLLAYAEGDLSKAFEVWQRALKINPEDTTIKKVLLRAFFNRRL